MKFQLKKSVKYLTMIMLLIVGVVSCKTNQSDTYTKEAILGNDGDIIRRCDFSTLDVNRVLNFMRKKTEGYIKVGNEMSSSEIRENVSYMTMFSFEYLFCATSGLVKMEKKSLPVQLILDQLKNADLMPDLAAKLINLMSAGENEIKFEHTGERTARLTIDLNTEAVETPAKRAILARELSKQSIGGGLTAVHFRALKRGLFPVDKDFGFSEAVPPELITSESLTGYENNKIKNLKATTLITYSLGGFASTIASFGFGGSFALVFALDDKIEIDITISDKNSSLSSFVDIEIKSGLRLYGVSKETNSGGNVLSALSKIRYKRDQIGYGGDSGVGITFLPSIQTYLDFTPFFDKKGKIRVKRDESMFEDGIVAALVGGTMVNTSIIAHNILKKSLGDKYVSRKSTFWAFEKEEEKSGNYDKAAYDAKYNFLRKGKSHWTDPDPSIKAIKNIPDLLYYTSADLFGSGKYQNKVKNVLAKIIDDPKKNPKSNNNEVSAFSHFLYFASYVWEDGIVDKKAYKWDIKTLPQEIEAEKYFKFLGSLRDQNKL